jgi:PPK2 family polyphosphate:nucleotide phosphotransferase
MIKLSEFATTAPKGLNKKYIKEETRELAKRIAELHEIMIAEKKHSLLVVLQGMDTSGKDGSAHETFKYCTPVGLSAFGFKKPTDEEFAHDFLWRVHKQTPGKGEIKVFVRSHYEDVLIQRVHNWIDEDRVTARINAINAFEENLINDNNTTILKFYMHLSKERQLEKLQERIDNPEKNWKHNPGDWKEREHWDAYMNAYEDAINRSTIPWIIAPVDQRWYRNYFIAKKVCETLESLNMKKPILDHAESKIG